MSFFCSFDYYSLNEQIHANTVQSMSTLLLVGGLLGSKRIEVAKGISREYGGVFLSPRDWMVSIYKKNNNGSIERVYLPPRNDTERIQMYTKMTGEFKILSKLHSLVVVSSTFHRCAPNEVILKSANNHFDKVKFVWLETSMDAARAEAVRQSGGNRKREESIFQKYERAAKNTEVFEPHIHKFPLDDTINTINKILELCELNAESRT